MSFLDKLFGTKESFNLSELLQKGALVLDVRSPAEYSTGHVKGSVNIPLQELERRMQEVPKDKPIVTCCASGMRSGSAESLLKARGYEVYNGGGWSSVQRSL